MKQINSHIIIDSENGEPILIIDTYELMDFIDDYLTEKWNIESHSYLELKNEVNYIKESQYKMFFSKNYNITEIENAISKLNETEIVEIVNYQRSQIDGRFYCLCCGYNTLSEFPNGSYEICSICFWEDDLIQSKDVNYSGGANNISLVEAQNNFENYGAISKQMLGKVRKVNSKDKRNPNWKKY